MVFDGDSHVKGNADLVNAWPNLLHEIAIMQRCNFFNIAQNGWQWQQVAQAYAGTTLLTRTSLTGVAANFWLHVGSNNISALQSGASIYAGVAAILAQAKADGFMVGATQIWGATSWSGAQTAEVLIYNGLLATDPSITPGLLFNGYTTFNDPDTLPYFTPGDNHLNPTGQALYAQNVAALFASSGNFI